MLSVRETLIKHPQNGDTGFYGRGRGDFCRPGDLAGPFRGPFGPHWAHYERTSAGTRRAAMYRLIIASAVKARLAFLARPR